MQKGVFLLPSWRQRRHCKEEAGEREAVHSQLSGSVGAGGSCLERIRGQWQGAALGACPSLSPHGCSRRGDCSCGGSKAAQMHLLSSNTHRTCLPLAFVGVVVCMDRPCLDSRQPCVPPRCQMDHAAALQTAQFGSLDLELPRQRHALSLLCAHQ